MCEGLRACLFVQKFLSFLVSDVGCRRRSRHRWVKALVCLQQIGKLAGRMVLKIADALENERLEVGVDTCSVGGGGGSCARGVVWHRQMIDRGDRCWSRCGHGRADGRGR